MSGGLTGGVPTGKTVMAKASDNLTPVTLELGGKGANIVFPDANLKYAAKAICFGIFMNAGQMCWAGSRLIVHEDIHDELVDAVVAEVGKWKVGPGMSEGVRLSLAFAITVLPVGTPPVSTMPSTPLCPASASPIKPPDPVITCKTPEGRPTSASSIFFIHAIRDNGVHDANLKYAAKAICFGIFMNAGQMCWAGSRLIVHEDIHDELVDAVVAEVGKWKVGPGMSEGVRIGSLVHETHRSEVLEKLANGLEHGGQIVCGGKAVSGDGAFMEATVVTDVDQDNPLFYDELFGPVLSVTKFATDEEALALANHSDFGLLNGIWTNNLSRAHNLARDLESGMVSINEYPITFPQTAFTGWKQSGIGIEQSKDALNFYTKVKNVNVKL